MNYRLKKSMAGAEHPTVSSVFSCIVLVVIATAAQAQTFAVLHDFAGPEGATPFAGLTMDRAGNLYGTTWSGGQSGHNCGGYCGTVFKLARRNSAWVYSVLYMFTGPDGANPSSRVVIGPDGNLYGTTSNGGAAQLGTVFRLQPPPTFCRAIVCPWSETVLHSFTGGSDGRNPYYGDLAFDSAGNIYGTTELGGAYGYGTVYQLMHSNDGWTEIVLHSFQAAPDGRGPYAGVIFDAHGNLYGTTVGGGRVDGGTIYELSPGISGWTETILYDFPNFTTDGANPYGGLIFDAAGSLYGTTSLWGSGDGGTAYELTPTSGGWQYSVLYSFTAYAGSNASLAMDAAGNLYGTLPIADTEVYRLTESGGHWSQTGFSQQAGDEPIGNVIFDANGNLFTTASGGGTHGYGVVFEITP